MRGYKRTGVAVLGGMLRDAVIEHAFHYWIMRLEYYNMDQGWTLFVEAKMCAFQMKSGTPKNHFKDSKCDLEHSKP